MYVTHFPHAAAPNRLKKGSGAVTETLILGNCPEVVFTLLQRCVGLYTADDELGRLLTLHQSQRVERELDNRPVMTLGDRTPAEVFAPLLQSYQQH